MSPALDTYAGALAVPLVDREDILEQIKQAIDDDRPYVFYITAHGGMGKTFLAREILRRCQPGGAWHTDDLLAAKTEVDLYHTDTHSVEGLMRALQAALQDGTACFETYNERAERFEGLKYDLSSAFKALEQERSALSQTFLEDLDELCGHKRVVLALDTAEKLIYENERVQEILGLAEEGVGVRNWLIHALLPRLKNAVVLIAGRPRPPQLRADLRRVLGDKLVETSLDELGEADALAYFRAVAATAREHGETDVTKRVELIPEETRRVIWLYTGGRPIMLALLIDYYLVTEQLLEIVQVPPQEAARLMQERPQEIREQLEANLVRALLEIGRPADETIRSLAWARKGMDAELLARVTDLRRPDGTWDTARAQEMLEELRPLSFVKLRHKDQRVFLHDEMYDLLERHVLQHLSEAEADRVYSAILNYYQERIEQTQKEIQKLQLARREEVTTERHVVIAGRPAAPDDPQALSAALSHLDELQIEEVHYRLRQDPVEGFETCARYAEKTVFAHNEYLDMQLRDELLEYSRQTPSSNKHEQPLSESEIDFDGIIRGIGRLQRSGQSEKAIEAIQRVREKGSKLLTQNLQKIELDIWEGEGIAYLSHEFDRAEEMLKKAIQSLSYMSSSDSEFQNWKRQALLARAHNALGYLQRVLGRFQDAITEYTATLPLWRGLKLEDEHANTLNNLAWALAEAGNFARAQRLCKDGLDLRMELGPRYPIALSYNTLGLIGTRYDQPHRARRHCERALSIFRDLGQPRGIGLASTALAEALRRSANVPGLYFPEERADLLRLGQQYAQDAVEIFETKIPEPLRLVEAYLELGCIYRDWAKLPPYDHTDDRKDDPEKAELLSKGERTLRQCAQVAHNIPYRQVDALVNLAWLYYHVGNSEQAKQTLGQALRIIPPDYEITEKDGIPTSNKPVPFFWVQMGKAALLEGSIAFNRYQKDSQPKDLKKVAHEYLLCLAYNELFSQDFRDLRHAKDQIYERLKKLAIEDLQSVFRMAANISRQYHMDQPRLLNFIEKDFGLHLDEKEQ